MSPTGMPCSNISGKATEESSAEASGDSLQMGVHVAEPAPVFPMCPILMLNLGSQIRDPIMSCLFRSKEHTHEVILEHGWSSIHNAPCVSGKSALKLVRKVTSSQQ